VRFTARAHGGLANGSITRTFRTWKRPQVKVGGRYHVGPVDLVVDSLTRVPLRSVTDADAQAAGFDDAPSMRTYLGRLRSFGDDDEVWRVDFHAVPPDDAPSLAEETDLTDADVEALRKRLDRLDAASSTGPWTRCYLELIAENPGVVSTELAAKVGRERAAFKTDVRKLKRMGLTISLEVGYRISPRGEAFLAR
jgi:predicted transcriptional regulator